MEKIKRGISESEIGGKAPPQKPIRHKLLIVKNCAAPDMYSKLSAHPTKPFYSITQTRL